MLIQNHVIFEEGSYIPQGSFPTERVKAIFEATNNSVIGHFAHSSYLKEGESHLNLAEFQNFQFQDGVITADIDFNEDGEKYWNDGILKGVSVEIDEATNGVGEEPIISVAFTPRGGLPPAVSAAEFEKSGKFTFGMEFEKKLEFNAQEIVSQIKDLDAGTVGEGELDSIRYALWDKEDEQWYVSQLQGMGYTITAPAPSTEFEGMSVEDITKKVEAKIERKHAIKSKVKSEFEEMKKKGIISKDMEAAGLTLEFMTQASLQEAEGGSVEFESGKVSITETIMNALAKVKPALEFGKVTGDEPVVKQEKPLEEKTNAEIVAEANKLMDSI